MAKSQKYNWNRSFKISLFSAGILIIISVLNLILRMHLEQFGIVPRDIVGLRGIIFSPLLHGSMAHLAANILPLFILMMLLFADRNYKPMRTVTLIWIASGVGTWLIGRGDAVHIGASSIILGLAAYLIAFGLYLKSWTSVLISLAVLFVFGGIFYGVLPQSGPISWEGHLCGAIAGIWAAREWRFMG